MRRYTILLDYDADVAAYAVSVPALPGCFTQAATVEEAFERAREAIQCHIQGLIDAGEPIPEDSVDVHLVSVDVPIAVGQSAD